jgi:hypothetical protein
MDLPASDGNYLLVGPVANQASEIWATIERNLVGPGTLGAEEVAEFMDTLDQGGPPAAARWLTDYLESVRAIYAIRIYPDAMKDDPQAFETIYEVRTALHKIIGGIGRWGDLGYTNDQDRLIWCRRDRNVTGMTVASMLDEFAGRWIEIQVNLDDPTEFSAFQNGEILSVMKDRVKT